MGIAQALYTGVTGLSVNSDGMAVIANNIANANAKGFKRDRAEFEDMLSMDLSSGSGQAQVGRGSRLSAVKTMHTQGGLQVTDNLTDLAIQGQGFFIISNPGDEVAKSAGRFYTRVGSLNFDKDGYFSTNSGGRVQGYMADNSGKLSTRLTDIRIETNNIPPKQTDVLTLNLQLDSRADIPKLPFDSKHPQETSNFSTSVTIFDSHGRAHQASVFLRKVEANQDGVQWEWHGMVDSKEVTDPETDQALKEFANGMVNFDKSGLLSKEITNQSLVNFSNGAFPQQVINFDFGRNTMEEGGNGTNASTSIAGESITVFHKQDGYEAGQIKTLDISQDGTVTGVFTNGIQRSLAAIALATFSNQNAIVKSGKNLFMESTKSGPPNIGTPKTGTRGSLYSASLEESNVDLAIEFVNMIQTQRLFQANSRSITTTDTMIEEVINLKR